MARRTWIPFLLLIAIAFAFAIGGFLPGRVLVPADAPRDSGAWKNDLSVRVRVSNSLTSDVALQLIPWDLAAARALSQGGMPWRNPLVAEGEDLFANPLAALLSPFTWPRLLFGLHGWVWTVFLKIVVAGLGMFWFAREAIDDHEAAAVSGALYALSGFAIVWMLYPHTNVFCVLPALAAAALLLARQPRPRNVFLVSAAAALATAGGHPETLFVGVITIAIFFIAIRKPLLPFLSAALTGFLLISVQLVPFLILLARSHVRLARSQMLPLHLRRLSLLAEMLPGYLGSPLRGELDLTGLVPGAENFHQRNSAYIGALAVFAIVLAWRELAPIVRKALAIAGGALILMLCVPGPAHLVRFLPLIQWVAFEYYGVAVVLLGSLAAGVALVEIARGRKRPVAATLLIAAGIVLTIAGLLPTLSPALLSALADRGIHYLQGIGLLHQAPAVYVARLGGYLAAARWTAIRRLMLPGLCWIGFGVALALRQRIWRQSLMGMAVLAEILAFGIGYNPSIAVSEIAAQPPAVTAIQRLDPERRWYMAGSSDVFPPNLATTYGVRNVQAYDILISESATIDLAAAGFDPMTFTLPPVLTSAQTKALATLGVRWWIGRTPPPGARLVACDPTPRVGVYELPGPATPPPANNNRPEGLGIGLICSGVGLVGLLVLMWAAASRGPG